MVPMIRFNAYIISLWTCSLAYQLIGTSSEQLPKLADDLRVDSSLVIFSSQKVEFFKVVEYVARRDGSIRLDVEDHTDSSGSPDNVRLLSYLRLFESGGDFWRYDNQLTLIETHANKCRLEHTSTWQLCDFSRMLAALSEDKHNLAGADFGRDRTAIGTSALLRLIYANAHRFKLDSKAFDELNMGDSYYFSLDLDDWQVSGDNDAVPMSARLIASMLVQRMDLGGDVGAKIAKTLLSEVNLRGHLSSFALIELPTKRLRASEKVKSSELLGLLKSRGSQLTVSGLVLAFNLVQERSLSRHTGLNHLSDELSNPFQLPAGLGCGLASNRQPFFVSAQQFSGVYGTGTERYFAAYDESTNHFRYDSLGEFKAIYSLDDHVVTYIATANNERQRLAGTVANKDDNFKLKNRAQCAQTSYEFERAPSTSGSSAFYNCVSLTDIVGLGRRTPLTLLGQQRFSDELHCQVFEREISQNNIPALLRMHLRVVLRPNRRYFLVFYLVDEINLRPSLYANGQSRALESMWLKRVELVTLEEASNHSVVAAQLTFSKSSWSLETTSEEAGRSSRLLHPARTFDTLECWPERAHVDLELVLDQVLKSNWSQVRLRGPRQLALSQMSTFEETLMLFLVHALTMPRAQINNIEVKLIGPRQSRENNETAATNSIFVSAKLTRPFVYVYQRSLMGWVRSYANLSHSNQARLLKYKPQMSYHECASRLAVEFAPSSKFFMLYCPNVGCGYLKVNNLSSLQGYSEVKSTADRLEYNYQACEIYQMSRATSARATQENTHHPDGIRRHLQGSVVSVYGDSETPYRAQVSRVFEESAPTVRADWDEPIIKGVCYTGSTKLELDGEELQNHEVHIVQLKLDPHHSLAQCRRACLLYASCQTYSYDRTSRHCTVSNIFATQLLDPAITLEQEQTTHDATCSIYALDQTILYKRTNKLETRTPAELIKGDSLVLTAELTECASLCHAREFQVDTTSQCLALHHLSLRSICVLQGDPSEKINLSSSFIVESNRFIESMEQLERFVGGKQELNEPNVYEEWARDYVQYFEQKSDVKMNLQVSENSRIERTLNGLSLAECLRECALLDSNCLSVDHCKLLKNGLAIETCHLFPIRSPYSFEPQVSVKLGVPIRFAKEIIAEPSDLELSFYAEGISPDHELSVDSRNCDHFYLTADNLQLKRLLVKERNKDKQLAQLAQLEEERSGLNVQMLKTISEYQNLLVHKTSITSLAMQLLLGLAIGLTIFVGQHALVRMYSSATFERPSNLLKHLRDLRSFAINQRNTTRPRSMSIVDIVELSEVDGDDG